MIWAENFYGVPFLHLIFHLITIEGTWIFIFSRISVFKKDISHDISALLTIFFLLVVFIWSVHAEIITSFIDQEKYCPPKCWHWKCQLPFCVWTSKSKTHLYSHYLYHWTFVAGAGLYSSRQKVFIPIIPSDINVDCWFTPSPFWKCILQFDTAYWISVLFSLHLWRKTNSNWCLGSITFSDKWEISVCDAIHTWF